MRESKNENKFEVLIRHYAVIFIIIFALAVVLELGYIAIETPKVFRGGIEKNQIELLLKEEDNIKALNLLSYQVSNDIEVIHSMLLSLKNMEDERK